MTHPKFTSDLLDIKCYHFILLDSILERNVEICALGVVFCGVCTPVHLNLIMSSKFEFKLTFGCHQCSIQPNVKCAHKAPFEKFVFFFLQNIMSQ